MTGMCIQAILIIHFQINIKRREAGCLGIIFHSDGKNNFGKIIIEQTSLNVLQFPEEVYDGRQKIEDDEW